MDRTAIRLSPNGSIVQTTITYNVSIPPSMWRIFFVSTQPTVPRLLKNLMYRPQIGVHGGSESAANVTHRHIAGLYHHGVHSEKQLHRVPHELIPVGDEDSCDRQSSIT